MERHNISRRDALKLLAYGAVIAGVGCSPNPASDLPTPFPTAAPSATPVSMITASPTIVSTSAPPTSTQAPLTTPIQASATPTSQVMESTQSAFVEATAAPPTMPERPSRIMGLHVPFNTFYAPLDLAAIESVFAGTQANCAVVDIKFESGMVALPFEHELKPAYLNTVAFDYSRVTELVTWLNTNGIYPIARIVVMSDTPMVNAHPHMALRYEGRKYVDVNKELWLDPAHPDVGNYTAAIALAAVQAGFPEIQLDYIRYPEADFSLSIESRVSHIVNLVSKVRTDLNKRAYLTIDVLGDSTTDYPFDVSDAGVGQHIPTLATVADGICPMLYPDLRGENIDVDYYDSVYGAVIRAKQKAALAGTTTFINPWIQAYYAAGRDRIIEQTQAAFDAGSVGVFAWNRLLTYPHGIFSAFY